MYATIEYADEFLALELWSDVWFASSPQVKIKALNKATRIIDRIEYSGEKSTPEQENEFPRNGNSVIPSDIQDACSYIALALVEGRIPELEYDNVRVESDNLASGKITYNTNNTPKYMLYGVPSYDAWSLLVKYIDMANFVKLSRVN